MYETKLFCAAFFVHSIYAGLEFALRVSEVRLECNTVFFLLRYVLAADVTVSSITAAKLVVFQHLLAHRAFRCIQVTSANTVGVGTSTAVGWPVTFKSVILLPRSSPVLSVHLLSPGRSI
jgi:hypothetical protein